MRSKKIYVLVVQGDGVNIELYNTKDGAKKRFADIVASYSGNKKTANGICTITNGRGFVAEISITEKSINA